MRIFISRTIAYQPHIYQKWVGSHASGYGMLTCICMAKCDEIYHVVQELWTFSLTERTDSHIDYSANPSVMQFINPT